MQKRAPMLNTDYLYFVYYSFTAFARHWRHDRVTQRELKINRKLNLKNVTGEDSV